MNTNYSQKKTILIIGAGLEQVRAYEQAKELGLVVVGTDQNQNAPAFEIADYKLICSTRNISQTLKQVLKFAKNHQIHGVMTVANDVPLTVATIAKELGLTGISPDSAKLASNKILMKERFFLHGVASPKFKVCQSKKEFILANVKLLSPKILKPSNGRGSRGVLFIDEKINVDWAWKESIQHSENGILILEEYVEGPQLSVEGLMLEGKFHAIAYADRNYSNMLITKPFIVEDGGVIPSQYTGKILLEIAYLIEKAALALDIVLGPIKADIVLTPEGPQIIELAARLSGNYLATHHIPMAYGVDIVTAVIRLSLGENISSSLLDSKHLKYMGVRYFFPPPGRIQEIVGVSTVRKLEHVKYLDLYRKVGDIQEPIINHTSRAGTIICVGNTYEDALNRVEETRNMIKFKVSDIS